MQTPTQFSCDACGRNFAWRPDLAGLKVRCKCGDAIRVPRPLTAMPPAPPPSAPPPPPPPPVATSDVQDDQTSLDDLYAFAGEAEEKARAAAVESTRCPIVHGRGEAGGKHLPQLRHEL